MVFTRVLAKRPARMAAIAVATVGLLAAPTNAVRHAVPVEQLVGQRLVVAMQGTSPSAALLERIRAGQIGGVILFGGNVRTAPQVRALTRALRSAAEVVGQPRLLIAVDQEGGGTRRFRWAPPARAAAELGRTSEATVVGAGRATALALRALGANVDLAPIADVPSVAGSFIEAQQRAYADDPGRAGRLAAAFAEGLADGGVAATAKHFPGLGRARRNTDLAAVSITASQAALASDVIPFRALIAAGVPLVMLSNATYPSLDAKPAAWSPGVQTLLRRDLGFKGVTITDALEAVAATHGRSVSSAALLAAQAGVDLLLVVGSERSSSLVFDYLVAAAREGRLPAASLQRSYERVMQLKR